MKVKTSELTGAALDWAAGICEGDRVFRLRLGRPTDWDGAAFNAGDTSDERWVPRAQVANVGWFVDYEYRPSTDWAQGGPIIDRMMEQGLTLSRGGPGSGNTRCWAKLEMHPRLFSGTTPLIAAMRCYVASKLGDEVEVPDGLA